MFILQQLTNGLLLGGVYAVATLGFALVWGVMNEINIAHAAFIAIGAYTSYFLFSNLGIDPMLSVPISMLVAFAIGFPIQRFLLNRALPYGLVITLATTFGLNLVLENTLRKLWSSDFRSITPTYATKALHLGSLTIPLVPLLVFGLSILFAGSASDLATFFFYAFAALALGSVILVYIIRRSRLGYALRAIQASEEAAVVMGINTTIYKVVAWAISAAVTGVAGGIYAYWTGYISPGHLFDIVKLFIMVLLGGAGTVLGPVLGAIGIEAIGQFFWTALGDLHLIALGLIILAVGLLMPKGFLNLVERARQRGSARRKAQEPAVRSEP